MRRSLIVLAAITAMGLFFDRFSMGTAKPEKEPVRSKFGLEKREPWTTSKVIGSPEPPAPYKSEPAFPKLQKFEEPLDLTSAMGTNRLFVAGRWGKIWSFLNQKDSDKADLVLEFKGAKDSKGAAMRQIIYALAFHPNFKDNGYMYVTWIPNPEKEGLEKGTRVSRYTVQGEPPVADLASEKIIFEWPNGGHNGGCLKFGDDGYLYLVTGDGSGIADQLDIGQDLSSIFAKLLRIDVDHPEGCKNYGIPKDNPFWKTPGARPEVYAYGLRQFWRFSFDRNKQLGLWGADIGQDLWESVYHIQAGGNYGWSVMEGNHSFRPERKKGPTPLLKPVVEHSHTDFRSITGGFIYRGKRLKELAGHYIYADFDTGRIWAFKPTRGPANNIQVESLREIARTTYRIVSWGEDAEGEIYFVDFTGGAIHQLLKSEKVDDSAKNFPRKLSQTGLFASTKDHKVATGIIPYSVNAQLWGDHAEKERFMAIPGNGQIILDEVTYPASPGAPPGWKFPDGTVLVKTFAMDMERGNPKSRKRLETRILHYQQFPGSQEYGDQYWRGYTYVWNEDQTDADLLDEKGADKLLKIQVGDKIVEQNYRFPSRAECTLCHTNAAKFALGTTTLQMNRDHNYDGVVANQLATLEHIGMFSNKLPGEVEKMPKLPDYRDQKVSLEDRARSYLHSNCSHCHIKWGGGNAEFKLHVGLDLKDLGIVNVAPAHGGFKIDGAKLLVPGQPEKSIILERMKMTTLGRMPHIGSRVVDDQAVQLVHDWIKGLK